MRQSIAVLAVLLSAACSTSGERRPSPQVSTTTLGDVLTRIDDAPAPPAAPPSVQSALAMLSGEPAAAPRDVRAPTPWLADLSWSGTQRVAHAKAARQETVNALFEKAGASWPPKDVLYRVFKQEREFEVWAGDGVSELKLIGTYGICAASGDLGPKRKEGDYQVPEGFYKVGYFFPTSSYYLAAQVNYPNQSDKIRGNKTAPGSDILIHGRCASIGCISMTDERVEEIYLVGWAAFMEGKPTLIHSFPSRDIDKLRRDPKHAQHHDFWAEIEPGMKAFDESHRIPSVRIEPDGRYVVTPYGA
jgi:murein L,D-transpeptidase YafK